jgi:hypothetical protein
VITLPFMVLGVLFHIGPQPEGTWLLNFLGSARQVFSEQKHRFPANSYKFMVNQVDGIGYYQS